ncbi:MAG: hypothetical protein WC256_02250 [Desulfurivibrionaceae bacterium]|jgi:hypothetical protein
MIDLFHGVSLPKRLFSFPITALSPLRYCTFFPISAPPQFWPEGKKLADISNNDYFA